jgi:hypothetical protein
MGVLTYRTAQEKLPAVLLLVSVHVSMLYRSPFLGFHKWQCPFHQ